MNLLHESFKPAGRCLRLCALPSGLLLLLLATALVPAATAQEPVTETEAAKVAPASEEAAGAAGQETAVKEPSPAEASGEAGEAPPSGETKAEEGEEEPEWLSDEKGRQYYVRKIPKRSLGYVVRLDENRIRTRNGWTISLHDEDDENFYQKVIKVEPVERPKGPSAQELAAVAKLYEVKMESSDVLELVPFDEGLPRTGLWRHGFDVADMNGDGHLDLVHGPPRKESGLPYIFLGDSRGHWRPWTEASFPDVPYDYGDAAADDLNGDGHQDVVLGIHARGIVALVGDGEGRFRLWSEGIELERPGHRGAPAFTSREVETVDWNGDARPDVVALSEGPRGFSHAKLRESRGLVVYLNQGDGTWVKMSEEVPFVIGHHLVVRDMNGDTRPDLVTSSSVLGLRHVLHLQQEDGSWLAVEVEPVRPKALLWAVAAADWNGDGRQDLAYSYTNKELGVRRIGLDLLLAREDGGWDRRPMASQELGNQVTEDGVRALDTADLDGDGALDLVAATDNGEVLVFRGDGAGFFVREVGGWTGVRPESEDRTGCRGYTVRAVDLDGDGLPEVLADFAGESCRRGAGGSLRAWKVQTRKKSPGA